MTCTDGHASDVPMRLLAPAKLNLMLKVCGRRENGYHELVSLMVPVALFDFLELKLGGLPGIFLRCTGRPVPEGPDNLAYRAAERFCSRAGVKPRISITLRKNIPIAAGLGGGSSDAANMLRGLNELYEEPLSFQALLDLAVELGADVPFFLKGGPCIARGIGELLDPIEKWPKFWYVIAVPDVRVSTAWAYRNLNLALTKVGETDILSRLKEQFPGFEAILQNDLESVTAPHVPDVYQLKRTLIEAGAEGALMSGSGPSVFGVFGTESNAVQAKEAILQRGYGDVFAVRGLSAGELGVHRDL